MQTHAVDGKHGAERRRLAQYLAQNPETTVPSVLGACMVDSDRFAEVVRDALNLAALTEEEGRS